MTAHVLENFFAHRHNALEVARQEYDAAKRHFREVCRSRETVNSEHDRRFRGATARRNAARDRYVELLAKRP